MEQEHYLFNLIVYLHDSDRIPYYAKLIQTMREKFSCHVLLIVPEQTEVEEAQNHYVVIKVKEDQIENLPLTIFCYLLPDIPIYLLWGQDPLDENNMLAKLQHFSHRLIFDSDTCHNLKALSHYLTLITEEHPIEVVDLNWIRISGWREAILKIFDTPAKITQLKATKKLAIYYNSLKEETYTQTHLGAYYLQLWLASRFSWELQSEEKTANEHLYHYTDHTVTLIAQTSPLLFPGCILGIQITSENEEQIVMQRIANDPKKIDIKTFDTEKCQLPYSFYIPIYYEGPNFLSDILFSQTSQHYLQAISLS